VIPIYLDGLYRNLPKGRAMIVPFGGNLIMGDPLVFSNEDLNEITARTQEAIEKMAQDLSDSNQI
jgi:adenosylmethionine-8-amino-7-oxononanoate aminotransferase